VKVRSTCNERQGAVANISFTFASLALFNLKREYSDSCSSAHSGIAPMSSCATFKAYSNSQTDKSRQSLLKALEQSGFVVLESTTSNTGSTSHP
jgi:hypothetical protein